MKKMTYIYMLCSLVNKSDTLSIICIFKGIYRTLQLYSDEITLQMKGNCSIRIKYNWEMKTFNKFVQLLTFLFLTCAKKWVHCVLGNSIFFLFSVLASECHWYEVTYKKNKYMQIILTWNENNRLWNKNFTYLVGL